ncbi:MAG: sigma-54-dependent Fis family transcriptional regulator [Pyrinomonadaceae bacterium]|nr:sigma-54-dependent Fis family transcriptional regulator [Pyrinomonadaceae bacterium]
MNANILIIEDDIRLRSVLIDAIKSEGHNVHGAKSAEEGIELLESTVFDVILTDVNLPEKSGLEFIPFGLGHNPNVEILVMTGFGTIDVAVQAMKLGASDFLCKPVALNDLISSIRVALSRARSKPDESSNENTTHSSIIAKSSIMLQLMEQIETIAPFKINALITGETGTGKELVARAIHDSSNRTKSAFVALNCAAIPEQLLEDELFGHVKGAYTGAQGERKGRFEQADGGTLFLDEIGDMNLALQSKLLRVLQESEFEKLGSAKTIKVDVRIVAATSANLEEKIHDGSFRADLYHRLNVVHLRVPPLRERPDDIPPIAQGLLNRFCKSTGLVNKTVSEEALHSLISYNFPGNVRQLQNAMERAAVFSGAETKILLQHLPEEIKNQPSMFQIPATGGLIPDSIPDEGIDLSGVVSQVERELLLQTLEKTGGNKMQAAKLLNMKRTTLVEKIKRLQIESDDTGEDGPISATGS